MTATTSVKRANTRLFITFLICIVGALMLAPSALADDEENTAVSNAEQALNDANYVIEHYFNDDPRNIDDYCVFYAEHYMNVNGLFVTDGITTVVFKYGVNNNSQPFLGKCAAFNFGSSVSNSYCSLSYRGTAGGNYYIGTGTDFRSTNSSSCFYYQSGDYFVNSPFVIYGNKPAEEVYITKATSNPLTFQYIQTDFTLPVDTSEQTFSDSMIMQYLHDNNIDVDRAHAWLVTASGLSYEIPISYDVPINYSGTWYIKQSSATPYLDRFTPVLLGEYDPAFMHNSRFVIYYPFNCKKLTVYGLYDSAEDYPTLDMYDALPEGNPTSANMLTDYPSYYYFQGRTYTGKSYTVENEENTATPIYIAWHGSENWGAAIPHFNDLLVGIDITVTDENGNETISRNSTSYNNFVTNYNQQIITGLTGSITGRTSFSGDWRGQNVNTSIDYNNNWSMPTDTNIQSLFSRVFTMGDGYVTTAVLGVLAIAFCAYILYGKS